MRTYRKCDSARLNTGDSKCPVDFGKMKGAIIVPKGVKLPQELDGETLEEMCHAARSERAYGVMTFVEYAKEGGEVETSTVGYGAEQANGLSARKDTFTMDRYYPMMTASLLKCLNQKYDVYFFDEKKILYGMSDGTDVMAGFPMNTIYPTVTPHSTSSEPASMTVTFAHVDPRAALEDIEFVQLGFNPANFVIGLTPVRLDKIEEGLYKVIEEKGGFDRTAELGELLTADASTLFPGSTAVSYDSAKEALKSTGSTELAKPDTLALYKAGIKGIEFV